MVVILCLLPRSSLSSRCWWSFQASLENPWPADLSAYLDFRKNGLVSTWSQLVENLYLTWKADNKNPTFDFSKFNCGKLKGRVEKFIFL
jgi:hypothetical protein